MRSTTSILDVLRNPRFLRFYLAQAVSQLGDAILWMALALVAVQLEGATRTNSPTTPTTSTTAGTRAELAPPGGVQEEVCWLLEGEVAPEPHRAHCMAVDDERVLG